MNDEPVKKKESVALPAKLYVAEGKRSADKTEQERHIPDPDDETFLKIVRAGLGIEETTGGTHDNS